MKSNKIEKTNPKYIKIESVSDLIKEININLSNLTPKAGDKSKSSKLRFYYRGESAYNKFRTPTLYRNKEITEGSSKPYYMSLMNELGRNNYQNGTELFQTLSELQHYEAITRMLDVTLNPLVALYFATYPSKKENETDHYTDNPPTQYSINDGRIYFYQSYDDDIIYDSDLTTNILSALNFIPREQTMLFMRHLRQLREIVTDDFKKR